MRDLYSGEELGIIKCLWCCEVYSSFKEAFNHAMTIHEGSEVRYSMVQEDNVAIVMNMSSVNVHMTTSTTTATLLH